jgi:hypothetical protein
VIRERLEYWTLVLGPKFSRRERAALNLRRFYAVVKHRTRKKKLRGVMWIFFLVCDARPRHLCW